ncbi:MAG TPA: succinylglutamate desuccinylase/aspartoacylase family protein [Ramlibacter sp.]
MATITLSGGGAQSLPPPEDLAAGNTGTPGVWRFSSGAAGPHVAITALIHGNEVCGAHAAWQLVQTKPRPARGTLSVVFCNLEAYSRLDDATKGDRRSVDEDLNRVWGRIDAATGSETYEMRRARDILPHLQGVDVLLDLHSMTTAAPALGLVGLAPKNVAFAKQIGFPALLVRDAGHAAGLRLIDRAPFGDAAAAPVAMLVECGEHFSREALVAAEEAVRRTVAVFIGGERVAPAAPQAVIEVTQAVTIQTDSFEFVQEWPNMSLVPRAGTLVARDGGREIRAPHDGTYMIMPASARNCRPGQTAVRFGRRTG